MLNAPSCPAAAPVESRLARSPQEPPRSVRLYATGSRVVSYIVGASDSPDMWDPNPPLDPTPCEWRNYDPSTPRDFSFACLPGSLSHVRWQRSFQYVESKLGRQVYRARWRSGVKHEVVLNLPVDSAVCDFWQEGVDSTWKFSGDRLVGTAVPHGNVFQVCSAEHWGLVDSAFPVIPQSTICQWSSSGSRAL